MIMNQNTSHCQKLKLKERKKKKNGLQNANRKLFPIQNSILKILEEKLGEGLCDLRLDKDF